MLLDIGAKTTDIIFAEDGRFFTRSVTAAGAFVTNSIAREYGLSFRDAEKLKLENGVVSLGNGHTDDMDADDAALATTIRNAMSRLSSEVQRTVNHYRAQYQGTPPTKAYICGGGARLAYTLEFLQSTLNIPVEYFNPLQAFSIGSKVDEEALDQDAICLGAVAGAAVSAAKVGQFNIDLVPTSVGKDRAEKALLPKVAIAGMLALAGAGFFAYTANDAAAKAERVLAKAAPADERVARLSSQIESMQGKYAAEVKKLKEYSDMYSSRYAYADVLKQLSAKSASIKFWVSEIAPLINYDVENTSLVNATDVKCVKLIDMNRSRSGNKESSINKAPDPVGGKKSKSEPMVTAIYVSGFTIKTPGDTRSMNHRQAIYDLVAHNFDERSADSLFAYENSKVQSNLNHYFQFLDAKALKKDKMDYVEKFMMVMPLKKPIAIPELSGGDRK